MPEQPSQIGPYTLNREIGRGGMGVVYLGHDTRLDRPVAIKSLPEHLAQDPERLARFEREARSLAALSHPNVAGIYGVEEHEGSRYLVLEFVDGETLAERLDRGPLPLDETIEYAVQIASGVEAAHDAGVIHRDLKPANIKVTPDGQVKVLDFGLAKASEAQSNSSSFLSEQATVTSPAIHSPSIPGAIMGTAPYMSPEQARGRSVDKRSDVWAFGVILYECLAGASPFVGETVSDSIGAILHKEIDLNLLPATTPPRVRRVITRCLERDKNQRFRDIGDARLELQAADLHEETAQSVAANRSALRWAIIALPLLIVGAASWFGAKSMTPEPVAKVVRFDVITDAPDINRFATSPQLSPDGKLLAFIQDDQINIRELASFDSRILPGTDDAQNPFWSPDGKWIGFHTDTAIFKISLTGGSAIKLNTGSLSLGSEAGGGWTEDNRIIFADIDLMQIPASGGEPTVLLEADEERFIDFHEAALIPGTNTVIYVEHRVDQSFVLAAFDGDKNVVLTHVTDGRVVTPSYAEPGQVLYTRSFTDNEVWAVGFDHKAMAVTREPYLVEAGAWDATAASDGTLAMGRGTFSFAGSIAWLNRDGGFEQIETDFEAIYGMILSPDGKHILFTAGAPPKFDIWIRDLDRGINRRITFLESFVGPAAWSPDSKEIAYIQFAFGENTTPVTRFGYADGSGESRPEMEGALLSLDAAWNNAIVANGFLQSTSPVRTISLETPEQTTEISALKAQNRPALSPDGTLIVYSADESGESQVYCTRYPDGSGKWQLSTRGGKHPIWSDDGAKVFFDIEGDEAGIYEVDVTREPSLQFGLPNKIFDLTDAEVETGSGWDITPDAQRILVVQSGQDNVEVPNTISIIQNWYEEHRDR